MSHEQLRKECMEHLRITYPELYDYCINYQHFNGELKPPVVEKKCSACHIIKEIKNFTVNKDSGYIHTQCKICINEKNRKKYIFK